MPIKRFLTARSSATAGKDTASYQGSDRRGARRRNVGDPAICIPIESGGGKAFVVGVHWAHHLTDEPLEVIATRMARESRCSHVHTNGRHGQVYGIVNVEASDISSHGSLVPLAVAFAKSVPDKNARSIYMLDMRDGTDDSMVFFAEVSRGSPIKEVLCPGDKYANLLATLMHGSSTPASLFVDTADDETFAFLSSGYASATQWPISKISVANVDPIHKVRAINLSTPQIAIGLLVLGLVAVYPLANDYYKANLQAKSLEAQQQRVTQQYILSKQQSFDGGYGTTPEVAVQAMGASLASMPMFRNGWQFREAICAVDQGKCTFEWHRIYGTNDSFIESAAVESLRFDAANYKVIFEDRPFSANASDRPQWATLPEGAKFVRDNNDRKDTFALAGVEEFNTDALVDLVSWQGAGNAPGPVLQSAAWSMSSPIDQVQEAVFSRRIAPEFGINKLTVTNRDGALFLKLEGKVYVRKT